jgi:hypothetical protein
LQSDSNSFSSTVAVDLTGFDGIVIAADAIGFSGDAIVVDMTGFVGIGAAADLTGFSGNKVADFSAHTGIEAAISDCSYG